MSIRADSGETACSSRSTLVRISYFLRLFSQKRTVDLTSRSGQGLRTGSPRSERESAGRRAKCIRPIGVCNRRRPRRNRKLVWLQALAAGPPPVRFWAKNLSFFFGVSSQKVAWNRPIRKLCHYNELTSRSVKACGRAPRGPSSQNTGGIRRFRATRYPSATNFLGGESHFGHLRAGRRPRYTRPHDRRAERHERPIGEDRDALPDDGAADHVSPEVGRRWSASGVQARLWPPSPIPPHESCQARP